MITSKGYGVHSSISKLVPFTFERNEPDENEVLVDIMYCGVCHADIHQSKNEYGGTIYPLVPGHEIVGRISSIGKNVSKFKLGELVGIGYFINSCKHCSSCTNKEEQYCENGVTPTHNGALPDGSVTRGGYSDKIVVNQDYLLHVSEKLDTKAVAPLLCAGITTYSSLRHYNVKKGDEVGVLGLGGLGHMAVKFASSFGAKVTVLSTSDKKKESALKLGAVNFINISDKASLDKVVGRFDFIIDTVSAKHDLDTYLNLLTKDGSLILLGIPPSDSTITTFNLVAKRRRIGGSMIGSISETQEMLDYCAEHNITSEVEVISPDYINEAFERTLKGDVHYRFVIDMQQISTSF